MMLGSPRIPAFQGTPAVAGTGWFDREGIERPVSGTSPATASRTFRERPYSLVVNPCGRCGGAGGADQWAHTGWTCFDCGGSGRGKSHKARLYRPEELAVLNESRDAVRGRKAAVKAAERAEYEAGQAAKALARETVLIHDPFYQEFGRLIAKFRIVHCAAMSEEEAGDTRPPMPDFLRDMWKRVQTDDLTPAQIGAVNKFIASQKDREFKQQNSNFLGTVGERITIRGKVVVCKPIYPNAGYQYGKPEVRYLVKFETLDRDTLTWFTSNSFTVGAELTGKATVKAHKEFRGVRETQIRNFRADGQIDGKQSELF